MTIPRTIWILGALAAGACGGDKQGTPRERPPLVVPSAKAAEAEDTSNPPARAEAKSDPEAPMTESGENVQIEVQRDGGHISISARTVRDGGFSFRMSGSVQVSTDGSSVSISIGSGDGGVP